MADLGNTKEGKKRPNSLLINISIALNVFALVSYVFLHDFRLLLLAVPGFIYLAKNKAETKAEAERRNWVSIRLGTFFLILPAGLILDGFVKSRN
jgi:hypothetical protein